MIFVDTSFWAALVLPKDAHHHQAVEALDELGKANLSSLLLTTNNVVLETITVARYEADHRTAVRVGELLYGGSVARLHRTTTEDEVKAFAYLRRHDDKKYSAVDCLSFVVMIDCGITDVLSFDDDFSHRFVMRPGKGK